MPAKHPRVKTSTPGVYRRGEKWLRVIDVPGEGGKRKQRWVTANTKRELDAAVQKIVATKEKGEYVAPSRVTVGDMLDRWEKAVATQVRPTTLARYTYNARRAKAALGNVPAQQLTAEQLDKAYAAMLESGVSAYTVVDVHSAIRDALSLAVRRHTVARNIALTVKPPRPKKKPIVTVDGSGAARLLAAVNDSDLRAVIALTLATGLRRSEVLGLQWDDMDLDGAELHVRRGLHFLKGQVVYEQPKSATSKRSVALPPSACMMLRAHRERMEARSAELGAELSAGHHVFVRGDFTPLRPDYVTHAFGKAVKRAGLKGLRFHDLRHSHATIMLAQGIHPKVVSDRLGHANIGITLDLYTHPGMDLQAKAAAAFDAALMAGAEAQSAVQVGPEC